MRRNVYGDIAHLEARQDRIASQWEVRTGPYRYLFGTCAEAQAYMDKKGIKGTQYPRLVGRTLPNGLNG